MPPGNTKTPRGRRSVRWGSKTCSAADGDGAQLRSVVQHGHDTPAGGRSKPGRFDKVEQVSVGCTTRRPGRRTDGTAHEDRAMSELLSKVVPLALAAAVNPSGILVLVALLATAKRSAAFLCAGFCAVFIGFGAVVLAFGLRLELRPTTTSAIIDLVAAALIAYLGVRSLRTHPQTTDAKKKRPLGPAAGLAAGIGLAATDFSSVIPYLVALKEIAISGVGAAEAWVALAVFLVICLTPMVAPVVLAYVAPTASARVLDPLRRVLTKHGNTIIAVVCFVIAVYLAVKGIRGL
jgi:threonine/homoserine/homoserine lactone efflux protein